MGRNRRGSPYEEGKTNIMRVKQLAAGGKKDSLKKKELKRTGFWQNHIKGKTVTGNANWMTLRTSILCTPGEIA